MTKCAKCFALLPHCKKLGEPTNHLAGWMRLSVTKHDLYESENRFIWLCSKCCKEYEKLLDLSYNNKYRSKWGSYGA